LDIITRCMLIGFFGCCASVILAAIKLIADQKKMDHLRPVLFLANAFIAIAVVYATERFIDPEAIAKVAPIYELQIWIFSLIAFINVVLATSSYIRPKK
jgi:hypothetical protein